MFPGEFTAHESPSTSNKKRPKVPFWQQLNRAMGGEAQKLASNDWKLIKQRLDGLQKLRPDQVP